MDEAGKVRGCLDPEGVNALTHFFESSWMPGIDGVVALISVLRQHLGNVQLRFSREDWKHGFRQLAMCVEDGRLLCALAWDKSRLAGSELRVFLPLVHLFGPRAGPNQFCRASIGLVELANVWLAIPAVCHMDDTIIVDTAEEITEARNLFVALAELLNCEQNTDKAAPLRDVVGCLDTCHKPPLS